MFPISKKLEIDKKKKLVQIYAGGGAEFFINEVQAIGNGPYNRIISERVLA